MTFWPVDPVKDHTLMTDTTQKEIFTPERGTTTSGKKDLYNEELPDLHNSLSTFTTKVPTGWTWSSDRGNRE
jgi:hypothetical protein